MQTLNVSFIIILINKPLIKIRKFKENLNVIKQFKL
jgi:hypothetical protein